MSLILTRFLTAHTILLAFLVSAQDIGTITQDIFTSQAYSQQKECAQSCFSTGGGLCQEDILGVKIGCAQSNLCVKSGWQARNACYCSAGLQLPGQEFLSACIASRCSVGDVSVDISIATSIYSRYCSEKGYVAGEPVSVPAATTGPNSLPKASSIGFRTSATATATSGGTDTGTTSSSSNSSGSTSISTGTIIGIVVGSLAGLAFLAIAMKVFWKLFAGCFTNRAPSQHQLAQFDQKPIYPTYPDQQPYYPSPGSASEVGPSDSVSMIGGLSRPAPTLVSDMRYPGRF